MNLRNIIFISGVLVLGLSASAKDRLMVSGSESEGGKIYLRNCAKCHELYSPTDYSQAEWDKWMVKMRRKSKLSANDFQAVQDHTQGLRKNLGKHK